MDVGGSCRYELPSSVALHTERFSSDNGLLLENRKPNRIAVEKRFAVCCCVVAPCDMLLPVSLLLRAGMHASNTRDVIHWMQYRACSRRCTVAVARLKPGWLQSSPKRLACLCFLAMIWPCVDCVHTHMFALFSCCSIPQHIDVCMPMHGLLLSCMCVLCVVCCVLCVVAWRVVVAWCGACVCMACDRRHTLAPALKRTNEWCGRWNWSWASR